MVGSLFVCLFFPFEIGSPTAQTGPELNIQSKLASKSYSPTSIFQSQGSRQGHYTQEGFKSDDVCLTLSLFPLLWHPERPRERRRWCSLPSVHHLRLSLASDFTLCPFYVCYEVFAYGRSPLPAALYSMVGSDTLVTSDHKRQCEMSFRKLRLSFLQCLKKYLNTLAQVTVTLLNK